MTRSRRRSLQRAAGSPRPGLKALRRRDTVTGLLFTAPWIIGLLAFAVVPVLVTLAWSFMKVRLSGQSEWVGVDHFVEMLQDRRLGTAVVNTLIFMGVGLPLQLLLSFAAALLLRSLNRLRVPFRAIVYLPTVIPAVASVYLWRWMLDGQHGVFNTILGALGLPPVAWIGEPGWARTSIIVMILWASGTTVIIYLAALLTVPRELYEAASIDGAGRWRTIISIDWPSVRNVTTFQLVMGFIAFSQLFAQSFLLVQTNSNPTAAGPSDSLLTISMLIYHEAFVFSDFGYASAVAWALFLVTLAGSLFIIRRSDRTQGQA